MLSEKDRNFLLKIARQTIECFIEDKELEFDDKKLSEELKKNTAVFVTLTIDGLLRGCMGELVPIKPLIDSVIGNALNAAFHDPRFHEVEKNELKSIKIEISVLSKPQELKFRNSNDLLEKINQEMGLILEVDGRQATFLPQVWEALPDKVQFLDQLSLKAGLKASAWREKKAKIKFYNVEKFEEQH